MIGVDEKVALITDRFTKDLIAKQALIDEIFEKLHEMSEEINDKYAKHGEQSACVKEN